MKFVFMDIDGVLRKPGPNRSINPSTLDFSADNLLRLIGLMSRHPDWDLVITSQWRMVFNFQSIGGTPVYGFTPDDIENRGRLWEVLKFLSAYPGAEWVAVDDDPLHYEGYNGGNVVICDPNVGLSTAIIDKLEGMMRENFLSQ